MIAIAFTLIFIAGVVVGLGLGIPLGQRHILRRLEQRADRERAARLEQVRGRALARLDNAREAVHRRSDYGVLEAKELS